MYKCQSLGCIPTLRLTSVFYLSSHSPLLCSVCQSVATRSHSPTPTTILWHQYAILSNQNSSFIWEPFNGKKQNIFIFISHVYEEYDILDRKTSHVGFESPDSNKIVFPMIFVVRFLIVFGGLTYCDSFKRFYFAKNENLAIVIFLIVGDFIRLRM